MAGIGAKIGLSRVRRSRRHCGFHSGNGQKKSQLIRVGTLSIGGGTRNRTRVRFPKRIAIEPASVRAFGLLSFFPRERYRLKSDADWFGERGSSRQVEPEFDSAYRNLTGARNSGKSMVDRPGWLLDGDRVPT